MPLLFHPLLHAAHLVEAELRAQLAALDIQPRQARILVAIGAHQPVSQAMLATAFAVSPPSMSVMLVRLERDGLVQRHAEGKSFRTALGLTPKGEAMLPVIRAAWEAVDAHLRKVLGEEQAQALSRLALALRDGLAGRAPSDVLGEAP